MQYRIADGQQASEGLMLQLRAQQLPASQSADGGQRSQLDTLQAQAADCRCLSRVEGHRLLLQVSSARPVWAQAALLT